MRIARGASSGSHIIVLHKYKAIYFAIPKVANSSLKAVCVDLLDIKLPPGSWKPGVFNTNKFRSFVGKEDFFSLGKAKSQHTKIIGNSASCEILGIGWCPVINRK